MSRPHCRLLLLSVALLLSACQQRQPVFSRYRPVPLDGWERSDTLRYDVPSLAVGGTYGLSVSVRTSTIYPFTSVTLVVDQTVRPSGLNRTDTVCVQLTDDDGNILGDGISHFVYKQPLPHPLNLAQGDSLLLYIRHAMRREILPGISDVGAEVTLSEGKR